MWVMIHVFGDLQDYYATLGVKKDANKADIKSGKYLSVYVEAFVEIAKLGTIRLNDDMVILI